MFCAILVMIVGVVQFYFNVVVVVSVVVQLCNYGDCNYGNRGC